MNKLNTEILRWSKLSGYAAEVFDELKCTCGSENFSLFSDDDEGGAKACCSDCSLYFDIENSSQFIKSKSQNICNCDNASLGISVGKAFYEGTKDVRWVYVGCSCETCGLVGVYCDWQER